MERRAAHQHLALRVLAPADGADLVLGEHRVPAEERLDGRVDGAEQRVDRAVAGALGGVRLAAERPATTLPGERPPWLR